MFARTRLDCSDAPHIKQAVRDLFGPKYAVNPDILKTLSLSRVRRAFREKARLYHPDLHRQAPPAALREKQEHFLHIQASYEVLKGFLAARGPAPQQQNPPKVIAVAGGKGGVGKSVVAANLAVHLAGQGRRVVLADLDPAGSTLHLYLGETSLSGVINDYLTEDSPYLEDLLAPSRYGPWLLGGENSRVFAPSQNGRAPHLKLWRALKEAPADFLVLDLGSHACPQTLDFFALADKKLLLTTCEPAAYLKAYLFLKAGLYRHLHRHTQKAGGLREILPEFIPEAGANAFRSASIPEILTRVQRRHPAEAPGLTAALEAFRPALVINQVQAPERVPELVTRLEEAARRMLGISLTWAGTLPLREDISRSTHDLVPAATRDPNGWLARRLAQILKAL